MNVLSQRTDIVRLPQAEGAKPCGKRAALVIMFHLDLGGSVNDSQSPIAAERRSGDAGPIPAGHVLFRRLGCRNGTLGNCGHRPAGGAETIGELSI
jgi:hypothetical protein